MTADKFLVVDGKENCWFSPIGPFSPHTILPPTSHLLASSALSLNNSWEYLYLMRTT